MYMIFGKKNIKNAMKHAIAISLHPYPPPPHPPKKKKNILNYV
jgi:hypothetical protein